MNAFLPSLFAARQLYMPSQVDWIVDLHSCLSHFSDFFVFNIDPLNILELSVFSIYWKDFCGPILDETGGSASDAN